MLPANAAENGVGHAGFHLRLRPGCRLREPVHREPGRPDRCRNQRHPEAGDALPLERRVADCREFRGYKGVYGKGADTGLGTQSGKSV